MSRDRIIHAFRVRIEELLGQVERELAKASAEPEDLSVLEHNTRVLFFDYFFGLLGWKRGHNATLRDEERIRSDTKKTVCYMDYVGANLKSELPVLIFEAKAWDKPFIRSPNGGHESEIELLLNLVRFVLAGGKENEAPTTKDWFEYIVQLYKYTREYSEAGHHPNVVAIGSGQWLVIFKEPKKTFQNKVVTIDDIRILKKDTFSDPDVAEFLHDTLGFKTLVPIVPNLIDADKISKYLLGGNPTEWTKGAVVQYRVVSGSWDPSPRYEVYPAFLTVREDDSVLKVCGKTKPYRSSIEENSYASFVEHCPSSYNLSQI